MKIAPSPYSARAVELYEQKWKARHPFSPPPLPPAADAMGDPLVQEAWALWVEASDQAEAEAVAPVAPSPQWTAYAGGMSCPNNHFVPLNAQYCPQCAEPVPPFVAADAAQKTEILGTRIGASQLRMQITPFGLPLQ